MLNFEKRILILTCFNTASGMDCMQWCIWFALYTHGEFQYRKRYGLHAIDKHESIWSDQSDVSIPQAVWIACNNRLCGCQIRKCGVSIPQAVWIACNNIYKAVNLTPHSFNTASGMDCMQWNVIQMVRIGRRFQYRKRYGLHAISKRWKFPPNLWLFQYRKRYGLHAIPSLTALGTAEPRSGFSKRIALFGKSPQPRGIFLSPKSAENVRKPCNIKETFVHGKNLKLMAFSREFLPSL